MCKRYVGAVALCCSVLFCGVAGLKTGLSPVVTAAGPWTSVPLLRLRRAASGKRECEGSVRGQEQPRCSATTRNPGAHRSAARRRHTCTQFRCLSRPANNFVTRNGRPPAIWTWLNALLSLSQPRQRCIRPYSAPPDRYSRRHLHRVRDGAGVGGPGISVRPPAAP